MWKRLCQGFHCPAIADFSQCCGGVNHSPWHKIGEGLNENVYEPVSFYCY
jgi:hypothetical protein